MASILKIPSPLRRFTDGEASIEVNGDSINKVLEELVTKGLVGLIFYLAIWIYLANVFLRQYWRADTTNQILILGLGAGLVTYFVQNLFLFDSVSTAGLFWVLVAFVISIDSGVLSNVDLVSDETTKKKKKNEQSKSAFRLLTSFRRLITYPLGFTCFIVIVIIGSVFFIYSFNITFSSKNSFYIIIFSCKINLKIHIFLI